MQIPSSYQPGYKEALLTDPDLAKTYIQHTLIGDPDADALIDAISDIDHEEQVEYIKAGMDLDEEKLRDAPREVGEFFEKIGTPPTWFAPQSVYPGCSGFHAYSDLFLTAFVTDIIIRGFTTLISQSFFGYRLSWSLLGDELADQLMFPKSRTAGAGTLAYVRLRRRIQEIIDVFRWGKRPRQRARNFITLLQISMLKPDMITYRLPNRLHADAASWW